MMGKDVVVFLFDRGDTFVEPWLKHGYTAVRVDKGHPDGISEERETPYGGSQILVGMDVMDPLLGEYLETLADRVILLASAPPVGRISASTTPHHTGWLIEDPLYQERIMDLVHQSARLGEELGVPWFIQAPPCLMSTFWRRSDHTWHPWHFAGYCLEDYYSYCMCVWSGGGFRMPLPNKPPVLDRPRGSWREDNKSLGNLITTGWAWAVFEEHGHANGPEAE